MRTLRMLGETQAAIEEVRGYALEGDEEHPQTRPGLLQ
jgi:hypothetical protein